MMLTKSINLAVIVIGFTNLASTSIAQNAAADEQAVRDMFTGRFVSYWEAGDAEALAGLWHEDGDWMSIVGSRRIRRGREAIAGVWSVGLEGRDTPEKRSLTTEIDAIRMHHPDLAQVDLVMEFGTEATGIVREAMVAIVEKRGDTWGISSARVARISATEEGPGLK